jgi:hypothetical protein
MSRSFDYLIKKDKGLAALVGEAHAMLRLDTLWQRLLPDALRGQSQVASLRDGRLLVFAEQAAVATRLRFLEGGLRTRLNDAGWPVAQIRIKIGRPLGPPARENHLVIGEEGLHALEQAAHELEDEGLKTALERLVRHQRQREG